MGFWQWTGLVPPRPPAAASPAAMVPRAAATAAGPPTQADLEEQQERIRNLIADTALKVETIRLGRLQLRVATFTVIVSVTSAIIGLVAVYENHRATSQPHNTYIFLTPNHQIIL